MEATVVHTSSIDSSQLVAVGNHGMQYGGKGDGFCFAHQSFDCTLTAEEQEAVDKATMQTRSARTRLVYTTPLRGQATPSTEARRQ
jgi:hypothetical protein